jgi:O-antigen ligase/tetratricopeptide (TPR) repeat protein
MFPDKLSKYLYRFIIAGLYLALLMPFIYVDNLVFPFITGKVFIFQILIEILLAAYLVLVYVDRQYLPRKSILLFFVTAFSAVEVLSTIFGVDRDRSFWGNYERMSGIFTLLHFFAYFIIAGSLIRTREDWRWYLRFALFLSAIQTVIGLVQYFSTNFLLTAGGGRIWGTLGNYIYTATYAIVHIFIGLVLWSDARDNGAKDNKVWQRYIGITIILNVVSLYLSGTRGGFVGFIVGLGVALLFFGFSSSHRRMKQIMVLGFCAVMLIGALGRVYRNNVIIRSLPLVGPLFNLDVSYDTGFTRLIAWEIALKAWKEKPIFGWGQENFYYAFNKYFNPRSLERGQYETWFDRPHNMALEVLSTQGSFGILAYLGIFGSVIWIVVRQYRRGHLGRGESAFALGGLVAYFTQNLFVFDQPSSFLLFYLMLAWFHSFSAQDASANQEIQPSRKLGVGPLFVVISLSTLGLMYTGSIKPWMAGAQAIRGERLIGQDFEAGFDAYKRAVSIETPYQDDLQIALARITHERAGSSGDFTKTNLEKVKFAALLLEEHAKNHPQDVFSFMALGQLYTALAQIDDQYFALAEKALLRASELSPKRQQVYYIWARVKVMRKDFKGAHELLQRTIEFNPRVADSHWYDGLIYNTEGDDTNAIKQIKEAHKRGYSWKNTSELLLYGQLLESSGAYDELPPLLEQMVVIDGSAQNYLLLAKSYERIGMKDKAQRALGKAIEIDPGIIAQLQAGQ